MSVRRETYIVVGVCEVEVCVCVGLGVIRVIYIYNIYIYTCVYKLTVCEPQTFWFSRGVILVPPVCTPVRLPLTLVPKPYIIFARPREMATLCSNIVCARSTNGNRRNSTFQRNPRTGSGVKWQRKVQIKPHSRELCTAQNEKRQL